MYGVHFHTEITKLFPAAKDLLLLVDNIEEGNMVIGEIAEEDMGKPLSYHGN